MERRYYTAETLRRELDAYERRFGLSSEQLYRAYATDSLPTHIDRFDAFVWADVYCERARLLACVPSAPSSGFGRLVREAGERNGRKAV